MLRRCAGGMSRNPGRHYFKCPADENHYMSFLWCDQLHRRHGSSNCSSGSTRSSPSNVSVNGLPRQSPKMEIREPEMGICRRDIHDTNTQAVVTRTDYGSYELRVVLPHSLSDRILTFIFVFFFLQV